jgi:DNA-nicking Smr family endonuclease
MASDARIASLAARFPGLADVVDTVLAQHGRDADAAFAALSAMVAEAPRDGRPAHAPPAAPRAEDPDLDLYAAAFRRLRVDEDARLARRLQAEDDDAAAARGATARCGGRWAASGGGGGGARRVREWRAAVDRIMQKYPWADRQVVVACHEAAAGDETAAEGLVVDACPDVLRVAHNAGAPAESSAAPAPPAPAAAAAALVNSSPSRGVAEHLRRQDVAELAAGRAARPGASPGEKLAELRGALKEATEQRDKFRALYVQTRNKRHERQARQSDAEASAVWAQLLDRLLCADADAIDLHNLTADQALEAVDAKLAQRRGRPGKVRLVTGRGNNSNNGAVLRPRIQRHLTALGVPHHVDASGGAVVAKLGR